VVGDYANWSRHRNFEVLARYGKRGLLTVVDVETVWPRSSCDDIQLVAARLGIESSVVPPTVDHGFIARFIAGKVSLSKHNHRTFHGVDRRENHDLEFRPLEDGSYALVEFLTPASSNHAAKRRIALVGLARPEQSLYVSVRQMTYTNQHIHRVD